MFVIGQGIAVPPARYTQRECFDARQTAPFLSMLQPRSRALLRKVLLGANGIETRHLALAPVAEAFDLSPDTLHARFARHAAPQAGPRSGRSAVEFGGFARLRQHEQPKRLFHPATHPRRRSARRRVQLSWRSLAGRVNLAPPMASTGSNDDET